MPQPEKTSKKLKKKIRTEKEKRNSYQLEKTIKAPTFI